jgi:hypothetical protein
MRFLFLFIFSLIASSGAFAQGSCGGLFADGSTGLSVVQELTALAGRKLVTATNAGDLAGSIQRLGLEVFSHNQAAIISHERDNSMGMSSGRHEFLDKALNFRKLKQELKSGEIKFSVEPVHFLDNSPLHIFKGKFTRGEETFLSFEFRTNGLMAILHSSHRYRSDKILDFKAVSFVENSVKSISFGRMVLDSLGNSVTLSRAMNDPERVSWIRGESNQLGSKHYHQRVHFALNYYYFNHAPYIVQLPKVLLERLFEENKLEINAYDTRVEGSMGMSPLARTRFGVEVEFVITKDAIPEFMPYLSPAVRQNVLDFGEGYKHSGSN